MIALYREQATIETSDRALKLLRKAGCHIQEIGNNIYSYFLTIQDRTDNYLSVDALLSVNKSEITVLVVWEMVYDAQKGMYAARNINGETGSSGKELAQKYMNAFLFVVENADIDNLTAPMVLT